MKGGDGHGKSWDPSHDYKECLATDFPMVMNDIPTDIGVQGL